MNCLLSGENSQTDEELGGYEDCQGMLCDVPNNSYRIPGRYGC
jgi:hypothetical protein